MLTVSERFWQRVEKTQHCWNWNGCVRPDGYGKFSPSHNEQILAHRYAWEETHGKTDLNVLHRCDNRRCVRLAHLFKGTHADNVADMRAKDRDYRKITWQAVQEIRRLYLGSALTQRQLAVKFGVTQAHIWHIIHKKQRVSR